VAWEEWAASGAPSTALDTPSNLLASLVRRSCSQFVAKAMHLPEQRRMLATEHAIGPIDLGSQFERPSAELAMGKRLVLGDRDGELDPQYGK